MKLICWWRDGGFESQRKWTSSMVCFTDGLKWSAKGEFGSQSPTKPYFNCHTTVSSKGRVVNRLHGVGSEYQQFHQRSFTRLHTRAQQCRGERSMCLHGSSETKARLHVSSAIYHARLEIVLENNKETNHICSKWPHRFVKAEANHTWILYSTASNVLGAY